MRQPLDRLFVAHPRSVDESYFEHMRFALSFSVRLLGAGLAALVHAFVPCLFETTASRMIKAMHARIANRGAAAPVVRDHGGEKERAPATA
jgi:hypothetical protein